MFWGDGAFDHRYWHVNFDGFSFTVCDGSVAIFYQQIEDGTIFEPGFLEALVKASQKERQLFTAKTKDEFPNDEYMWREPYIFKIHRALIGDDGSKLDSDLGYLTLEILDNWYTRETGKSPVFSRFIAHDWHEKKVKEARQSAREELEEIIQAQVKRGISLGVANAISESTTNLQRIQDERKRIEGQIKTLERESARLEALEEKARAKAEAQANQVYDPSGYVYVLKEVNGTHYKIGRTVNPNNRVKTFNVKLPFKVEYEVLIKSDDMYKLERELHNCYASKRVSGEWFALDEADLTELRALTNN